MRIRRDPIELSFVERARALRRRAAAAERTAWRLLRNRQILGLKFRRQRPIKGFVVDFYCAELRLVLELDGAIHEEADQASYDKARTASLEHRGFIVERVRSRDVSKDHLTQVLQRTLSLRTTQGFGLSRAFPLSRQGEGVRG